MNQIKKQEIGNSLIIYSLFMPILLLKISKIFGFYFTGISAVSVFFSVIYIFIYKKEIKNEVLKKGFLLVFFLYIISNINYLLYFDFNFRYFIINNIYLINWALIPYFMGLNYEKNIKFKNNMKLLYIVFLLIFVREIIIASKTQYYRMFDDSNTLLMTQFYNFVTIYLYMEINSKSKKVSQLFLLVNIFLSFLIGTKGIVLSSIIILSINFYLGLKKIKKLMVILCGAVIYIVTFIFRIKGLNYIENFEYNFGLWRYKDLLIALYKRIFFLSEKHEALDTGRDLILQKWFQEYSYKYFFGNPYYYNLEKGDYIHQAILDIIYRFGLILGIMFLFLSLYIAYLFIYSALKNKNDFIMLTTATIILIGIFSSSIIYNSYFWFGIGVIMKNKTKNFDITTRKSY